MKYKNQVLIFLITILLSVSTVQFAYSCEDIDNLVSEILLSGKLINADDINSISDDCDINHKTSSGWTIMSAISLHGADLTTFETLVSRGSHLDALDENTLSPVSWTVHHQNRYKDSHLILRELLRLGANPDSTKKGDISPIMDAANWKKNDHVRLLIDYGADLASVHDGSTPLHVAAAAINLEAMKMMIAAGADVNQAHPDPRLPDLPGQPPLFSLLSSMDSYKGNISTVTDAVKLLIDNGATDVSFVDFFLEKSSLPEDKINALRAVFSR